MRKATGAKSTGQERFVWCLSLAAVSAALSGCADDQSADQEPPQSSSIATTKTEATRIQSFIDSQYGHTNVRNTFRTRVGQDIDCVDFAAQPAFKMMPGLDPNASIEPPPLHGQRQAVSPVTDLNDGTLDEAGNVRRCPAGTVPIARISEAAIERSGGLSQFLSHAAFKSPHPLGGFALPVAPPAVAEYEYAVGVRQTFVQANMAESFDSTLSVYQPDIESTSDHSISQVWVESSGQQAHGGCSPNCVQTLEVGWNVDWGLYGDSSTHLFIYSTQDGYNNTGCYNLISNCGHPGSGFVVWSGAPYTPGQVLTSSLVGSDPVEIKTEWESGGSAWWLFINDRAIGYIPISLFNNGQGGSLSLASYYAGAYQAGGEVYDSAPGGLHTTTDMGSGNFASAGYRQSAYQRNLVVWNDDGDNNQIPSDALLSAYTNDPADYTETTSPAAGGTGWGSYFYFGGPGAAP